MEGAWPEGHPLPLPEWAACPTEPLELNGVWEYEEVATNVEMHVQRLLEDYNYDTVGNFLALHRGFAASKAGSFAEFFQS